MMIQIGLLTLLCLLNIEYGFCACKSGAKPCDWEPWQQWGSCSRTCGAGFRTRSRKLCCGDILPDCASNCHRGNNSQVTEICSNSCPNGGTVVDGICQCPPLKYGTCCEYAESKKGTSCARHCTWTNWYLWGDCSTDCGCGTRVRKRSLCCSKNLIDVTQECSHCSWNPWQEWTLCNKECGGGQRSRSRTPCCCKGQSLDDCLFDCHLSVNETVQLEDCNEHCHNNGRFVNGGCVCRQGFTGSCCSSEIVTENCTKCSWKQWEAWRSDSDDGLTSRIRRLCCPHGQSPGTCMDDCSKDAHTDLQWNNNYRKEIIKENCTKCSWKQWEAWRSDSDDGLTSRIRRLCCPHGQSPGTCMDDCSKDAYTDLQWNNNYRKASGAQWMYAVVASLSSVALTSLVWIACFCLRQRKCRSDPQKDTRGTDVTMRGTDVTTRGRHTAPRVYYVPGTERGDEHSYEEIEQSHYVNLRC